MKRKISISLFIFVIVLFVFSIFVLYRYVEVKSSVHSHWEELNPNSTIINTYNIKSSALNKEFLVTYSTEFEGKELYSIQYFTGDFKFVKWEIKLDEDFDEEQINDDILLKVKEDMGRPNDITSNDNLVPVLALKQDESEKEPQIFPRMQSLFHTYNGVAYYYNKLENSFEIGEKIYKVSDFDTSATRLIFGGYMESKVLLGFQKDQSIIWKLYNLEDFNNYIELNFVPSGYVSVINKLNLIYIIRTNQSEFSGPLEFYNLEGQMVKSFNIPNRFVAPVIKNNNVILFQSINNEGKVETVLELDTTKGF